MPHGGILDDRGDSYPCHFSVADFPVSHTPGDARDTSNPLLCQSPHLPLYGWIYDRSHHGKMEPAQAYCPADHTGDWYHSGPYRTWLHGRYGVPVHVDQQYRRLHDDGYHRHGRSGSGHH